MNASQTMLLNAQGYTQAAWWNRIPFTAWMLLVLIAIACNLLLGYGVARDELRVGQIDADTAKLQAELWGVVERVAKVQPTPIVGLVVSGMNDVGVSHCGH